MGGAWHLPGRQRSWLVFDSASLKRKQLHRIYISIYQQVLQSWCIHPAHRTLCQSQHQLSGGGDIICNIKQKFVEKIAVTICSPGKVSCAVALLDSESNVNKTNQQNISFSMSLYTRDRWWSLYFGIAHLAPDTVSCLPGFPKVKSSRHARKIFYGQHYCNTDYTMS